MATCSLPVVPPAGRQFVVRSVGADLGEPSSASETAVRAEYVFGKCAATARFRGVWGWLPLERDARPERERVDDADCNWLGAFGFNGRNRRRRSPRASIPS